MSFYLGVSALCVHVYKLNIPGKTYECVSYSNVDLRMRVMHTKQEIGLAFKHTHVLRESIPEWIPTYEGPLEVMMANYSLLLLPFLAIYFLQAAMTRGEEVQDIYYALFTSGPEGGFDTSGTIPAMELAEEEILKDPSILGGYSLTHTPIKDTQVPKK